MCECEVLSWGRVTQTSKLGSHDQENNFEWRTFVQILMPTSLHQHYIIGAMEECHLFVPVVEKYYFQVLHINFSELILISCSEIQWLLWSYCIYQCCIQLTMEHKNWLEADRVSGLYSQQATLSVSHWKHHMLK